MKTYASVATTPHFHGLIATDICGSDFRNSDNSGPNKGEVNRPQRERRFSLVVSQNDYEAWVKADTAFTDNRLTLEELSSQVAKYAHSGRLVITRLSLGNLHTGESPTIERMDFNVELDLGNAP